MGKKMKKLLALLLTAITVFGSIPNSAYAQTRETDIFPEIEHAEVNFEDMQYVQYDTSEFYKNMEQIRELYENPANEAKVKELFFRNGEIYDEIYTMLTLANLYVTKDVTDIKASDEYLYSYSILLKVNDDFLLLAKEILNSECSAFLNELFSEEEVEAILSSEQMTEEQERLANQEQELLKEYQQRSVQEFTVEYGGIEYNETQLVAAFYAGAIAYDTALSLQKQIYQKMNQTLGEIFLQLVEVRKQEAASYGYENYGDYAYQEIYLRDYTQKEIREFHSAVKKNLPKILIELQFLYRVNSTRQVFQNSYSKEVVLPILQTYIPELSSEMEEALNYMLNHHLYDLDYSPVKMGGAYTTTLNSYKAPFIMAQPNGNLYDFSTVVHEFGHYNSSYYNPSGWDKPSLNIDIAEIHSQGLELLFFRFYPEIFGEDSEAAKYYTLLSLCSSILEGCLQDELQQYIYAEENLTLEKINQKYNDLLIDYGSLEESSRGSESYEWVAIPHTFQSPFYYISYAVSAAAAFEVWLESQGDYNHAVDQYLELVSYGYGNQFQDTLDRAGYEDPLTEEFITDLAEKIEDIMELQIRIEEVLAEEEPEDVEEPTPSEKPEDAEEQPEEEPTPSETPEEPAVPTYQIYTVKKGDTLAKIAAAHKVADWKELAEINGLVSPYTVYAGKNICLPNTAVMKQTVYTVQKGDTLGSIGKAHEIDWRVIAEKNKITEPYTIYAGQKLILED